MLQALALDAGPARASNAIAALSQGAQVARQGLTRQLSPAIIAKLLCNTLPDGFTSVGTAVGKQVDAHVACHGRQP